MASGPKLNLGVLERKVAYSGEGIRPAVESGLLAARTIASAPHRSDAEHLDAYRVALETRFGRRGAATGPELLRFGPPRLTRQIAGWLLGNPHF